MEILIKNDEFKNILDGKILSDDDMYCFGAKKYIFVILGCLKYFFFKKSK